MGFQVQDLAPKVTVQGRTFCVSAFEFGNIAGTFFCAGIFERQVDGSWNRVVTFVEQDHDILKFIQDKGGRVEFIKWFVAKVNAFFAELFGNKPAPTGEPTTEAEAKAMIAAAMLALSFKIVDGVPVLS